MREATITLTRTEIQHLLVLLDRNEQEGSYWGRKDYYRQRASRLIRKLVQGEFECVT